MAPFLVRTLVALSAVAVLSTPMLASQVHAEGFDVNVTSTDLALRGVDPVSYFVQGEPVTGEVEITALHNGAVYRFASEQNKALFVANPDRYVPQYGGYCAYGLARGVKVDGDPNVWTIVDDKLYVNLSRRVGRLWNQDTAREISEANAKWPTVKDIDPAILNR